MNHTISLSNQLSNLVFVVDEEVLSTDVHLIIHKLIKDFDQISSLNLNTNIELSYLFAVDKSLMTHRGLKVCDQCEIVLKYIDSTVCLKNIELADVSDKDLECNLGKGVIKFYIKQKSGDTYNYTRINVATLKYDDDISKYQKGVYIEHEEMDRLENAKNSALSRHQSDMMHQITKRKNREYPKSNEDSKNAEKVLKSVDNACIEPQVDQMKKQKIILNYPSQKSIDVANTVATDISQHPDVESGDISILLIFDQGNLPLRGSSDNGNAIINDDGIEKTDKDLSHLSQKPLKERASVAVDACLLMVPRTQVGAGANIRQSKGNWDAEANPLSKLAQKTKQYWNQLWDKSDNYQKLDNNNPLKNLFGKIEHAKRNVVDYYSDHSSQEDKPNVTPVSKNLGILTHKDHANKICTTTFPTKMDQKGSGDYLHRYGHLLRNYQ